MGLLERMTVALPKKPSELRRLDAEELIKRILPRCQVRPYVYNQIAMLTKEFQNEADFLAQGEAKEAGVAYKPLARTPFVMHFPADVSQYTMEDRKVDVALLSDILAIPRRSLVAAKLSRGKMVLENDLKQMEREYAQLLAAQKRAARAAQVAPATPVAAPSVAPAAPPRVTQGSLTTTQTLTMILPSLVDRPALYNQVCNLIQSSSEEDKTSPEVTPEKRDYNREMSSEERWKDVERLDEIIDFLEDGTVAKASFEGMKLTALAEAKAAQKIEAERMVKKGFHPLDRLDDIPLAYY